MSQPRFLPMLVPPKLWQRHDSHSASDTRLTYTSVFVFITLCYTITNAATTAAATAAGVHTSYLSVDSCVLEAAKDSRLVTRSQLALLAAAHECTQAADAHIKVDALRVAQLDRVYNGLNCLGRVPWRIHDGVYAVAKEENVPIPASNPKKKLSPAAYAAEKAHRKSIAELAAAGDEQALAEKTAQVAAAKAAQRGHAAAAKAVARNRDLHSLRSDLLIKLGIADQFVGRDMFFPHNLDFRGRAYPIPPNLNHMGNDFTRGVLRFAEAKRLGPRGLYWLKVQ
eukprot:1940-Heterococcus_DN1.PRE.1